MPFSSARDGSLIVWDLFDGMEQRRCLGHGDQVYDVAFSPDGSRILSTSGAAELTRDAFDATLRLWDPATCEQLRVINLPGPVIYQAAFTPDGRHALATGSDGVVKVVDLESGAVEARVAHTPWQTGADQEGGRRLMVPSLDVSQEHHLALTGSVNGIMLLWNLDDAFSRDRAALQPPSKLGLALAGTTGVPWAVAISPDGRTALSDAGTGGMIWWDLETGAYLRRFASSAPRVSTGTSDIASFPVRSGTSGIAFLPNGRSAISVNSNGQIIQWDLESGDDRYLGRHDGIRGRVEVSPDGRFALTSGWNGELAYWDLETGEALRRFGRPGITFDIDMSPDGRYALTASSDRSVTLWDLSLLPATYLLEWISANRYVRELSCDEQVQYGIASSCP